MFAISIPSRVKYWMTEVDHDCHFIVGHEGGEIERFGAAKLFLMGNSTFFRDMLKDSNIAEKDGIRITDVEPNVFRNFLTCCYCGNAIINSLNFKDLIKLLEVSHKYSAHEITKETLPRLRELFCFDNIFEALSHPCCYYNHYLGKEILMILKFDFKKISSDARFLELDITAMKWILEQDNLVVNELEIWNEIVRWAKHITGSEEGSVIRSYIEDILKYFRFMTMEFTDFWKHVVSTGILNEEEVRSFCNAFGTGDPSNIDLNQTLDRRYMISDSSKDLYSSFVGSQMNASIFCTVNLENDIISRGPWKNPKNSLSYHWADYVWMVQISKIKTNWVNKPCKKKYALSVHIACQGPTSTWNFKALVEFELFCRGKPGKKSDFVHNFTEKSSSIGYENFYDWDTLVDPVNGFIQKKNIFVMVRINFCN